MSKNVYLIRNVKEVAFVDSLAGNIIATDSPLVKCFCDENGLDYIYLVHECVDDFWEKIAFEKIKVHSLIDTEEFLKLFDLDQRLLSSLNSLISRTIYEYLYEINIFAAIRSDFPQHEVYWGSDFMHEPNAFFKGCLVRYVTKIFSRLRNLLSNFARQILFFVSIKKLKNYDPVDVLFFSEGSGLRDAVDDFEKYCSRRVHSLPLVYNSQIQNPFSFFKNYIFSKKFLGVIWPRRRPTSFEQSKVEAILNSIFMYRSHDLSEWLSFDSNLVDELVLVLSNRIAEWGVARNSDFQVLKKVLACINPKLFMAQHSLDLSACCAVVCGDLNIASVLVTHGSHAPNDQAISRLEVEALSATMIDGPFDFSAIQSPFADRFFNEKKRMSSPICTSPVIVKGYSENSCTRSRVSVYGEHHSKFVILHAGTPKPPNYLRPFIYETVGEYVENIKVFLEVVEAIPDLHVALKVRPSWGLNRSVFLNELSKFRNWSLYDDGKIEDYIINCDAVVSYSSTVIEQAIYSNKLVFCFSPRGSYSHLPPFSANLSYRYNCGYYNVSAKNFCSTLNTVRRYHNAINGQFPNMLYQKNYENFKNNNKNRLFDLMLRSIDS